MPDFMSVCLQDIMHSRKSDLRKQKVRIESQAQENKGERQRSYKAAALCMLRTRRQSARL